MRPSTDGKSAFSFPAGKTLNGGQSPRGCRQAAMMLHHSRLLHMGNDIVFYRLMYLCLVASMRRKKERRRTDAIRSDNSSRRSEVHE